MAEDKARDDKRFNCSEDHEIEYVVGRYPKKYHDHVRKFLKEECKAGRIYHSTHAEVYEMIKKMIEKKLENSRE